MLSFYKQEKSQRPGCGPQRWSKRQGIEVLKEKQSFKMSAPWHGRMLSPCGKPDFASSLIPRMGDDCLDRGIIRYDGKCHVLT